MTVSSRRRPRRWLPLRLLPLACVLLSAPAWCDGPVLTRIQLVQLLKVVETRGSRTTIPGQVASALQLQPAQHTPDIKEAAWRDEAGNKHGFAPLNDHSGFFLFSSGPSAGHVVYLVDPALHLVRAARSLVANGPVIALPQDEAQKELDQEFARWSGVLTPPAPDKAAKASAKAPAAAAPAPQSPAPPKP
jgi:hypothetical protein